MGFGRELYFVIEDVENGGPAADAALKKLFALLLGNQSWNNSGSEAWAEVAVAVGRVHTMFFDDRHKASILSMWSLVLSSTEAPPDQLRHVVEHVWVGSQKFVADGPQVDVRACSLRPLPEEHNAFAALKAIMDATESRASVDEALLVSEILAKNGGARCIVDKGCEALIIHASAPLRPVAVTTAVSTVPIHTEDEIAEGGLIVWSDGKLSSTPYIASCQRDTALRACCTILTTLTEEQAHDFSVNFGRQLAIDSTSDHTLQVLDSVSNLPHAYLITSTLLPPIITSTRTRRIHRNSVIQYLVADHPEYLNRRWLLEALALSNDDTLRCLLLELYGAVAACLDPCFKKELLSVLCVLLGRSPPPRSSDSETPSPSLREEVAGRMRVIEATCPIALALPDALLVMLETAVFGALDDKYSCAARWYNALDTLLKSRLAAYYSEDRLGPLTIGHIPNTGTPHDIAAAGLSRLLALSPEQDLLVQIWNDAFPQHPSGHWADLSHAPVNLVQTSPGTKFEFRLGWMSFAFAGDTSAVKDKCLTPAFNRHLLFLSEAVKRCGYAVLVGPSSHKTALAEVYAALTGRVVAVVSADSIADALAWSKGQASEEDNAFNSYVKGFTVLLFDNGVIPSEDILATAKENGVVVICAMGLAQYRSLDRRAEAVWCDPLPTEEVVNIVSWALQKKGSEMEHILNFLFVFHQATRKCSQPQSLGDVLKLGRAMDEAETGSEADTIIFETVSWVSNQSEADRAMARAWVKKGSERKMLVDDLCTSFEVSSRDADEAAEARIQAFIQRETGSKMRSMVRNSKLGKKLSAWRRGKSHDRDSTG
ncbi:hypothetical protein DIPPA_14009 [Diplonema papillatum]|nr:hypothetical protein DIPPA_14009 [Diplonema papillatum]